MSRIVAVYYLDEIDQWGVFEFDSHWDEFKFDWHRYGPRIAIHNAMVHLLHPGTWRATD